MTPEAFDRRRLSVPAAILDTVLVLMPDPALVVAESGVIEAVNPIALALFASTRDELVGQPLDVLVPKRWRSRHRRQVAAYNLAPRLREMGARGDLVACRADRTEFPAAISLAPLSIGGRPAVLALVRDLSDSRAVLERARGAEQREREAREIHDVVIQRLFGSGIALESLLPRAGSKEVASRIARVVDDLSATLESLRAASGGLEAAAVALSSGEAIPGRTGTPPSP